MKISVQLEPVSRWRVSAPKQ